MSSSTNDFLTINDLVSNIKTNINKLSIITDTLLYQYRAAAEIIDESVDHRKTHIQQLKDFDRELNDIVSTHPALAVDRINQKNIERIRML